MQLLGSKGTLKKGTTHWLYAGNSSAAPFLLLFQQGWQGPKIIAKLRCSVVCMYWVTVLIPVTCGQITHIISFILVSGLLLFWRTAGDILEPLFKVCNLCILRKTAKITCKDTLVKSIWKCHEETCFLFCGDQEHIVCNFFSASASPPSSPSMKSNKLLSFLCTLPRDLRVENIAYELSRVLLYPIHVVSRHTEKLFFSCSFSSALFKLQFCLKFFSKNAVATVTRIKEGRE